MSCALKDKEERLWRMGLGGQGWCVCSGTQASSLDPSKVSGGNILRCHGSHPQARAEERLGGMEAAGLLGGHGELWGPGGA